jgi:CDP-diacylglycerol--glycerol-3-phosphate 3-phosphatidyltransferase
MFMNLPNKITVSRLFLAPLFFVLYFLPEWSPVSVAAATWVLLVVYALIELSDLIDGIIARRYHLITDLGKVLDPFADVIGRITYFVCLTFSGIMPLWAFLIIMYRELSVTFLRMILMGQGVAMAASIWGKAKAVLYAVSAVFGILYVGMMRLLDHQPWMDIYFTTLQWVFAFAAAASLASFISYFLGARKALSTLSR